MSQVINDVVKMNDAYIKSFECMKSPTKLFRGCSLFIFENPSVLCTFHRIPGKLDEEYKVLSETVPNYYKITEGNGKGVETLMKAEILYNQGNLNDADILTNSITAQPVVAFDGVNINSGNRWIQFKSEADDVQNGVGGVNSAGITIYHAPPVGVDPKDVANKTTV